MDVTRTVMCLLVFVSIYTTATSQISFSTNWGSGKRNGGYRPPDDDDAATCFGRLEFDLLRDLAAIVRREAKQAAACLLRNKGIDFD